MPEATEPIAYSKRQLRAMLDISDDTIDRLVRSGELEAVQVGPRTVRITRASLDAHLERGAKTKAAS
jgi:excisionase family DNA binding protein